MTEAIKSTGTGFAPAEASPWGAPSSSQDAGPVDALPGPGSEPVRPEKDEPELTQEEIDAMKAADRKKREEETRLYVDLRKQNCVMTAFEEVLARDMQDGKLLELRTEFAVDYTPAY